MSTSPPPEPTRGERARAWSVHVYTASGVLLALLAAAEICRPAPDPRMVFLWLVIAVLIDATDGPLARRWQVATRAPRIAGRTIDDIVDYLTFTFVPLLLVWRMGWLPPGGLVYAGLAMVASLFGFANVAAKDDARGFFLGFPSYWNVYAFYAGLLHARWGGWVPALLLLALAVLTVMPVRFLYPNRVPHPWRGGVLVGAGLWLALLVTMLPRYPTAPGWLLAVSLVYPAVYVAASWWLLREGRRSG